MTLVPYCKYFVITNAFGLKGSDPSTCGQVQHLSEDIPAQTRVSQSIIATARVHPALAALTFTGKHETVKPVAGRTSRLCSFSIWK